MTAAVIPVRGPVALGNKEMLKAWPWSKRPRKCPSSDLITTFRGGWLSGQGCRMPAHGFNALTRTFLSRVTGRV
jgi:hypothetical protein